MAFKRKGAISSYSTINSTSGSTTLGSAKDSITIAPEEGATTITKLVADDLEKPSVKYHWITKSAAPRQIKGTVTIDGKEYSKTALFNVEAPTSSFNSNTTEVVVYCPDTSGYGRLIFGNGVAGITFSSEIDGEGGGKLFQRLDSGDTRRQRNTGEWECRDMQMYGDGDLLKALDYNDSPNEPLLKKLWRASLY